MSKNSKYTNFYREFHKTYFESYNLDSYKPWTKDPFEFDKYFEEWGEQSHFETGIPKFKFIAQNTCKDVKKYTFKPNEAYNFGLIALYHFLTTKKLTYKLEQEIPSWVPIQKHTTKDEILDLAVRFKKRNKENYDYFLYNGLSHNLVDVLGKLFDIFSLLGDAMNDIQHITHSILALGIRTDQMSGGGQISSNMLGIRDMPLLHPTNEEDYPFTTQPGWIKTHSEREIQKKIQKAGTILALFFFVRKAVRIYSVATQTPFFLMMEKKCGQLNDVCDRFAQANLTAGQEIKYGKIPESNASKALKSIENINIENPYAFVSKVQCQKIEHIMEKAFEQSIFFIRLDLIIQSIQETFEPVL